MLDMMNNLMPNVMADLPRLYQSIIQTFVMLFYSGIISFFAGGFLGVLLIVTKRFGIMENILVYEILSKLINFFRAIPFIILLAMLVPLTRFIMGTAIGVKGAIIPLIFGTVPFFARQIESALAEVNPGLVEAAQSMGSSPIAIIFRVYLKESIAPIARGTTITAISLIGLTAMAGAVGAGGLGTYAIQSGYYRNKLDIIYVSVILLVILVGIIQAVGNFIVKKATH
ncbi:methionine ABC transporter permease [Brachyspira hampsonii]|uniref:ABC transporter permease n=1 Tax=Brachyspira hampsonii TaxID=1287055 RepID=A0AAC9XK81_9SPIR|nr:methionine ABC transporter permease [Brachyspira hampsonii]ASJ21405.1 ABC transporter permease [Brachyspira hampsonii]ELV05835.1 binding-protein-dependent transport system inner membrane protein [Brachyspira hampsonii 30599]MBW5379208.1 ABC transporter permease [Brachyspira hampsonii]MBW5409544.1 ABC transporter permease [Brachyspira hampsonii]OEJ19663.1 ABC transporter permease [Brachyspira hampsonii]